MAVTDYANRMGAILARLGINNWGPDPDYNLGVTGIAENAAIQEIQDAILGRRLGEDYNTSKQRLGDSRVRAQESLMGTLADNGIINSGANLVEHGKINKAYGEQFGDLTRDFSRGQEDISQGSADRMQSYTTQVSQLARAQALREEERRRVEAENAARTNALRSLGIGI